MSYVEALTNSLTGRYAIDAEVGAGKESATWESVIGDSRGEACREISSTLSGATRLSFARPRAGEHRFPRAGPDHCTEVRRL